MVKVSAFQGIVYNQGKVNISDVIAPPYDVISPSEQEGFYEKSVYNIVRLILGKEYDGDYELENKYTRAARDFSDWQAANILTRSDKPCIYYYVQDYTTADGETISRKGFIARNYIETYEEGNVLPHEYTMGGPKQDRLNLTKACNANFSQIFMTYSDPEKAIDAAVKLPAKPFIDVVDNQGIRNRLYEISDVDAINKISEIMKDKQVLIADGHHRYETSIAYRNYVREKTPGYDPNASFNWVMAFYTNLDDENLKVYPTHRIVTRPLDKSALLGNMDKYFDVVRYSFDAGTRDDVKMKVVADIEELSKTNIAFGACFKGENEYRIFKLREKQAMNDELDKKDVPAVMKKLDLTILHKIVLSEFLGFSEEDQMAQNGVIYLKKLQEAFEEIESARAEVVFIMATPHIHLIKEVSAQGYRMPQKSTYFYPKLASGLVINPLG